MNMVKNNLGVAYINQRRARRRRASVTFSDQCITQYLDAMNLFNHITVLTTILLAYKVELFKCDFKLNTTNNSGFIQNEVQRKERQATQGIDLSRMYLPPKQVVDEPQSLRNGFNAPSGLGNNCDSGILDQGKFEPTASVESYDYASSNLANSESNSVNYDKKNSPGNSGEYSSGALEENNFGEKINKNYYNGQLDFSGNNYNSLSNGSPQSRVSSLAGLNNGYAQNQGPLENSFGKQQSFSSGSHVDVGTAYNSVDKNFSKSNNRSTGESIPRNSFDRGSNEEDNPGNSYGQTSFGNNNNQNRIASPHSQVFDSKGSSPSSRYEQGVANPQLSNVQNFKSPNFLLGSSEYSTGVNGGNQGNSVIFNQSPIGSPSNNGYDQKYREAGSITFPEDSQNYRQTSSSSSLGSYGPSKLPQSVPINGQNYRNNRWSQTSDNNADAPTNILKAFNQQRLTASFDSNNKDQSIPQQFSKNIGSNYRSIPSSPTSVRYSQEHRTPVNSNSGGLPKLWFNMPLSSSQPLDRITDNSVRNTKKYSTLVPKDRYQNSNMPGQIKNSYESLNNNIGSYEKPGLNSEYGEPESNSFFNFAPGNIPNSQSSNTNSLEQGKNVYETTNNDGGGYAEPGPNSFSNFAPGNLLNKQTPSTSSLEQGKKVYGPSNNNGGYEKPNLNLGYGESFLNFALGSVQNRPTSNTNSLKQGQKVYGSSNNNGKPGPNSFSNFAPGKVLNSQISNTNSIEQGKNVHGPANNNGGYGEPGPNSFSNFAPGNVLNRPTSITNLIEQGKKVHGPANNNGGYGEPGSNSFSNFAPGNIPNSQSSNTNTLEQGKKVYGPSSNNNGGYSEPGPNSFSNFAPGNILNSQTSNTKSIEQGKKVYRPSSNNNNGGYSEPGPNSFSNFAPGNVPNSQTSNTNSIEQGKKVHGPANNNGGYGEPGPNSFSNSAPGKVPISQTSNNNLIEQEKKVYWPSFNNNGGYSEPGPNSFSNFAPGNVPNSQTSNTKSIDQGKKVYGPSSNNNNGGYSEPGPNSFSNFAPGNILNSQTSNTNSIEQGKNVHGPANNNGGYGEPGPNSFSNFAPGNVLNRPTSITNSLEQGNNVLGPANDNGHYGEPGPNSFSNFAPSNSPTFQPSSSNIDCGSSELEPSSYQPSDAAYYFSS